MATGVNKVNGTSIGFFKPTTTNIHVELLETKQMGLFAQVQT